MLNVIGILFSMTQWSFPKAWFVLYNHSSGNTFQIRNESMISTISQMKPLFWQSDSLTTGPLQVSSIPPCRTACCFHPCLTLSHFYALLKHSPAWPVLFQFCSLGLCPICPKSEAHLPSPVLLPSCGIPYHVIWSTPPVHVLHTPHLKQMVIQPTFT
jgi:hypothetical protein